MLNLLSDKSVSITDFLLNNYITVIFDKDTTLHTDFPVTGSYNRLVTANKPYVFRYHDKEYNVAPGQYVLFRCDILHGARIKGKTTFKAFRSESVV